jgi:lysophospholipase L1-like esterase
MMCFVYQILERMMKAVLFGHSYIRRMRDAIEDCPRLWTGPGPRDLVLKYVCKGGMQLNPAAGEFSAYAYLEEVARQRPDIIFIHLGENDLGQASRGRILEWLIDLVEALCTSCRPRKVIISQMTLFPTLERYASDSYWINERLRNWYKVPAAPDHPLAAVQFKVWYHRIGIFGANRRQYYAGDNVHLNSLGLERYCRSVSATVGGSYNDIMNSRH